MILLLVIANKNAEVESAKEILDKLKNFKKIKNYPLPKKFVGKLRNYQKEGYKWLLFLREYKLNGCLADDMGLGKTVQTLAMLEKLKEDKSLGTTLLVAPVSTLPNWESEIERFTPGLTHIRHSGISRKKDIDHLKNFDLIIVSLQDDRKGNG